MSVAREPVGKHVPAKKNSWRTIGKGLSIARQRAVTSFVNNSGRAFYVVRAEPIHIRSSENCSKGFIRKTSFRAVQ
jgi:hypothetical protein